MTSRRLLLAIGLRDVWPDVPGVEKVYGANAHVCPDCDGYDVARQEGRRDRQRAPRASAWRSTSRRGRATSSSARTAARRSSTSRSTARSSTRSTFPCSPNRSRACATTRRASTACMFENGMQLDADKVFFAIGAVSGRRSRRAARLRARRRRTHRRRRARAHVGRERVRGGRHHAGAAARDRRRGAEGPTAALAMHKSLVPEERKLTPREHAVRRRLLHGDRARLLVANDLQRHRADSRREASTSSCTSSSVVTGWPPTRDDHVARAADRRATAGVASGTSLTSTPGSSFERLRELRDRASTDSRRTRRSSRSEERCRRRASPTTAPARSSTRRACRRDRCHARGPSPPGDGVRRSPGIGRDARRASGDAMNTRRSAPARRSP